VNWRGIGAKNLFLRCLTKLKSDLIKLNSSLTLIILKYNLILLKKKKRKNMKEWLPELSEEDRAFIKRFILASGSLKALAKQYQVSYPTLRIRLNRLINKIKVIDDPEAENPFRMKIRMMAAETRISTIVAKEIINAYEKEKRGEKND
jgi:hypothetical protein